jgi:hypothetical protein
LRDSTGIHCHGKERFSFPLGGEADAIRTSNGGGATWRSSEVKHSESEPSTRSAAMMTETTGSTDPS